MRTNPGLVAIGGPVHPESERTLIVLGNARGGTSMLSSVLVHLGVFVGDEAVAPLHEDGRLARAMSEPGGESIEAVVAEYDRRHRVWGFKLPAFGQNPALGDGVFRGPVHLAVFRDALAVAQRRSVARGEPLFESLAHVQRNYARIVDFLAARPEPALLVSYEKALDDPRALVDAVVGIAGLSVDDATIEAAVASIRRSPLAYQALHSGRPKPRGHLDEVTLDVVRGWAADAVATEPVEVTLLVDGAHVATTRADGFRADLERTVHPTGRCAFRFDALPDGALRRGATVRVLVADVELVGSPAVVPGSVS